MTTERRLREQLVSDLERLHGLILRRASGDASVRRELDELEGAVQVKFALWRAARAHERE